LLKQPFSVQKSVQKKLFLAFLSLTLTLSFLVGLFAYILSFNLVKNRITESFSITLDYICSGIAAKMQRIYHLSDYIFINQTIKDAIQNGGTATPEAWKLSHAATDTIKQYAISQFYEDINRITIIGFNGYQLKYNIDYADFVDDGLSKHYTNWIKQATVANGQCVWGGLISRSLNPFTKNSPEIRETLLFRTIKNSNYTDNIGMVSIFLNSRFFLNEVQHYYESYPDFARHCKVLIVDNYNKVINTEDCILNTTELAAVLKSKDALTMNGHTVNSHHCLAFVKAISGGWRIVGLVPTAFFTAKNSYLFYMSLVAFGLSILVCGLIWFYVSSGIFKPIHAIGVTMQRIAKGDSALRINITTEDEIGQLGQNLNSMLERLDALNKENLDKELKMLDAMHRARQAQINPHFIYNTLNSIRWLAVMINAESIKKAIDAFWSIAKYNTNSANEYFSSVWQEVAIVKQYIHLQKLSYVNKFEVQWDISPEVLDCECLKFFLQPLVENAIIHGAFPQDQECAIYISAYSEAEQLVFNIYDNGAGMKEATLRQLQAQVDGAALSGHVGLLNIFERLRYAYKDTYTIDISSQLGEFTNIMIKTPLRRNNRREA
jgi:two-component system sensor histidine kinase YesM